MSKATEYVELARVTEDEYTKIWDRRRAVNKAAPTFECDDPGLGVIKTVASVLQNGSLAVTGYVPIGKVADFVKWLLEVYAD